MQNKENIDKEENEVDETTDASVNPPSGDWETKCAEMDHKYKLALADYQNLLKQSTKDRRDAILYSNEALILELLPIYDNLKYSVAHASGDGTDQWLVGISHVCQQFKKALEDAGVTEIITSDTAFDPVSMEAVENRETEDAKLDHKVADELKGGYKLHDKVIVPARVAVYKLKS